MTENTAPRVHSSNLPELELRVEKANRRAERCGIVDRFVLDITNEVHEVHENGEVDVYFEYSLAVPALKFADWELIAAIVIEEGGTVLRIREGKDEIIAGWQRPGTHHCEACGVSRHRTRSYVVANAVTGEIAQVGSDCLQRYTGITLGNVWVLDWYDAETLAELAEDLRPRGEGGPREARTFSVDKLVRIAYVVSEGGKAFVSQSAARDFEKRSTTNDVHNVLFPGRTQRARDEAAAALRAASVLDESLVAEILASAENVGGEYGENLRAVTRSEVISGRSIGLLVSVVSCWFRATEQKRENRAFVQGFVGSEKERLRGIKATVARVRIIEGLYDYKTIVTFRSEDGHCLVWFATGDRGEEFDAGKEVTITGTVKKHEIYGENLHQTVLTRCVVS